jgi:hypothetical protein
MALPSDNETWIIDAGDAVIQKKATSGIEALSPSEHLIYCLWVADYGMRNAGDLVTAADLYPSFQTEAVRLANRLHLPFTQESFSLPHSRFSSSSSTASTASVAKSKTPNN